MNEKSKQNKTKNQLMVTKWYESGIRPLVEKLDRSTRDVNTLFFFKELKLLRSEKSHEEYLHSSLSLTSSAFACSSELIIEAIKNIHESAHNQADFRVDTDGKKLKEIGTVIETYSKGYLELLSRISESLKTTKVHDDFLKLRNAFIKETMHLPDVLEFEAMSILFREQL